MDFYKFEHLHECPKIIWASIEGEIDNNNFPVIHCWSSV